MQTGAGPGQRAHTSPAGQYTLAAWHERIGEQLARLVVQPGEATTIEVALPIANAP